MSSDIVVIEDVDGWTEDVVSSGPESGTHGDLFAHKYPRQKGVKRDFP
jgi:hypothetical protein